MTLHVIADPDVASSLLMGVWQCQGPHHFAKEVYTEEALDLIEDLQSVYSFIDVRVEHGSSEMWAYITAK